MSKFQNELVDGRGALVANGTFTLKSMRTGEHRTIRVETIQKGKMSGVRKVGILNGPRNTDDFLWLGSLTPRGFRPWKSVKSQKAMAKLIEQVTWCVTALGNAPRPDLVEIHKSIACRRCDQELTTPESVQSGIGPVCAKREERFRAARINDENAKLWEGDG